MEDREKTKYNSSKKLQGYCQHSPPNKGTIVVASILLCIFAHLGLIIFEVNYGTALQKRDEEIKLQHADYKKYCQANTEIRVQEIYECRKNQDRCTSELAAVAAKALEVEHRQDLLAADFKQNLDKCASELATITTKSVEMKHLQDMKAESFKQTLDRCTSKLATLEAKAVETQHLHDIIAANVKQNLDECSSELATMSAKAVEMEHEQNTELANVKQNLDRCTSYLASIAAKAEEIEHLKDIKAADVKQILDRCNSNLANIAAKAVEMQGMHKKGDPDFKIFINTNEDPESSIAMSIFRFVVGICLLFLSIAFCCPPRKDGQQVLS